MSFRHLKEEEITYFKHMVRAWEFSYYCFLCSIKSFIHGLWPDLFSNTSEDLETKIEKFVFEDDEKR